MVIYERVPFYYETDQMKIIHHANYIRWFEEARVYYLEKVGIVFAEQEAKGIVCPVLTMDAQYKKMVRFGEPVEIETRLNLYNGLRYGFSYVVRNQKTKEICCTGASTHCFINPQGNLMKVKKEYPEMHALLTKYLAEDSEN